jgi:ribosome-associated protein
MDIRKLQRVILDALEDVKAQHIEVFNTEEQSPLFERVIIASGTSNRQTKALASSVFDAVKSEAGVQPRVEGQENGEWIIVDCGAAVVHVMQPAIREYYHLEEIWGAKPVRLKMGAVPVGLVKASAKDGAADKKAPASEKAPAKKVAAKKVVAKKFTTRAVPAKRSGEKPVAAKKAPAKRAAVEKAEPSKAVARKAAAPTGASIKTSRATTASKPVAKKAPVAAKKAPVAAKKVAAAKKPRAA